MAAPSEDIAAALVASDGYSSPLAPRTSQKGHALSNALKGGKKAKPNVTAAVKLAEELEAPHGPSAPMPRPTEAISGTAAPGL